MTTIRFIVDGKEHTAQGEVGQNLLQIALDNDIDLDHACGGVCACSTCHIKVTTGADALSEATEDEEDQLDEARDVSLESRLACQATILREPEGAEIALAVPSWNVNLVQEEH